MRIVYRVLVLVFLLAGMVFGAQKDLGKRSVTLFDADVEGEFSFESLICNLREVDNFTHSALKTSEIGQLGWAASRSVFASGGDADGEGDLINIYFVIASGVFRYEPEGHLIKEVCDVDVRENLSRLSSDGNVIADCQCIMIIAGDKKKMARRFGVRYEKRISIEVGRVVQNIRLQAAALGLGTKAVYDFEITAVRKFGRLETFDEPVCMVCVGYLPEGAGLKEGVGSDGQKQAGSLVDDGKLRAAIVVSSKYFDDEEFGQTYDLLNDSSIETVVVSTQKGVIKGISGSKVESKMFIEEVVVDDYDAIIFIGGIGAKQYFGDEIALKMVKEAVAKDKVVGVIGISSGVLASAGVVDGKRVTGAQSERSKLKEAGAIYTSGGVERDGLIITAIGPEASGRFAKVLAKAIQQ